MSSGVEKSFWACVTVCFLLWVVRVGVVITALKNIGHFGRIIGVSMAFAVTDQSTCST